MTKGFVLDRGVKENVLNSSLKILQYELIRKVFLRLLALHIKYNQN